MMTLDPRGLKVENAQQDVDAKDSRNDTDPRPTSTCVYCGDPIDPGANDTYHEATTFFRGPKRDSPIVRNYTGELAHSKCVHSVSKGRIQARRTLLGTQAERRARRARSEEECDNEVYRDFGNGNPGPKNF